MYKIVVYWRWDKGEKSADCFWCVPWPEMSNDEFGDLVTMAENTYFLRHGSMDGFKQDDPEVLAVAGYPEAGKMLRELPAADLRARFNQMEQEIFNSEVPLTREQIEAYANSRRR